MNVTVRTVNSTCQVDYAVDVFRQLNPDDPDPEGKAHHTNGVDLSGVAVEERVKFQFVHH